MYQISDIDIRLLRVFKAVVECRGKTNVTPGPIVLYCFIAISAKCAHCSLAKIYRSSSHASILTLFPLKCSSLGGYFSASTCLKPLSALPVSNKTVTNISLTEIKLKAMEIDKQLS